MGTVSGSDALSDYYSSTLTSNSDRSYGRNGRRPGQGRGGNSTRLEVETPDSTLRPRFTLTVDIDRVFGPPDFDLVDSKHDRNIALEKYLAATKGDLVDETLTIIGRLC